MNMTAFLLNAHSIQTQLFCYNTISNHFCHSFGSCNWYPHAFSWNAKIFEEFWRHFNYSIWNWWHPYNEYENTILDSIIRGPGLILSLSIDKSWVLRAIGSFPNGSSGGSDGFQPGHLKDLINCREMSDQLLDALTEIVNLVLSGCCPDQVRPAFLVGDCWQ